MKNIPTQVTLQEIDEDYKAFVEKFKPKKTTDDCYTPDNVFAAVLDWVCKEYGINERDVVRPFYPGGDYQRYEYAETSVVVDNPPFSIITEIVDFYLFHEIPFFLFAPHLTNFNTGLKCCHVIEDVQITYENGARVNTSFLTNLDDRLVVASPELHYAVKRANNENTKASAPLPKYVYPPNVITAASIGWIVNKGVPYELRKEDAVHIRTLDSQRAQSKSIFGSGFLISDKAAADKAAADKADLRTWELSEREKAIIKELGTNSKQ